MHFYIPYLLQGIGIGILISIPLGPVGLIVMKRTAEFGLRAGMLSGLAIVVIDSIGAILVLLGLHHTIPYLSRMPHWLTILGSILIFFYGLRIFFSNPSRTIDDALPWHKHFFSAVALALTNPSTYFSFGVIGLILTRFIEKPLYTRVEVAIGFFLGALLWWLTIAFVAFTQRNRYLTTVSIQRTVGIIIMILAIASLFRFSHETRLFTSIFFS